MCMYASGKAILPKLHTKRINSKYKINIDDKEIRQPKKQSPHVYTLNLDNSAVQSRAKAGELRPYQGDTNKLHRQVARYRSKNKIQNK